MYCPAFLNVNFKNVQLAGLNLVAKSLLLFQETRRGILTSTGRYLACMSVHLVFTFLLAKVMSSFLPTIKMQLEKHVLWR